MSHNIHTEQELQADEKILLVAMKFKDDKDTWSLEAMCEEMDELVRACSGKVVANMKFNVSKASASNLIGNGRLNEIEQMLKMIEIDTIIFSHDIKASQQRNLEKALQVKTIDRTQLILDIFAKHATSKEGKIQVELAQLEYLLPRLVGKGIELSRLGGGIGTLGPGETKLEVDRRHISKRVSKLKKDLNAIVSNRTLKRQRRKNKGMPMLALVGYTNAGKSTLLNALTGADQKTRDGLFTTLDSLTRQMALPNHQKIVLSDTVGFMHQLPHHLIESFKATLEEVHEADVLLHVIDASELNFRDYYDAVNEVLKELDSLNKPIILVFNKCDRITDEYVLKELEMGFEHAVCVSALDKDTLSGLYDKIIEFLTEMYIEVNVNVPIDRMDLVSLAHKEGEVYSVKYYTDSINIRASVPKSIAGRFDLKASK